MQQNNKAAICTYDLSQVSTEAKLSALYCAIYIAA